MTKRRKGRRRHTGGTQAAPAVSQMSMAVPHQHARVATITNPKYRTNSGHAILTR